MSIHSFIHHSLFLKVNLYNVSDTLFCSGETAVKKKPIFFSCGMYVSVRHHKNYRYISK